jgi:tetratricopeptide (TPR) repeat protein
LQRIRKGFFRVVRGAASFWVLVIASGCALYPQTQALLETPPEKLPTTIQLTSVPFFPQTAFHCGPAALASILTYHSNPVSPEQLADSLYIPGRQGTLQSEIVATARRYGFAITPLQPDLDILLTEVAAQNPVLVLQNLGVSWLPQWHYATVVGYDLPRKAVYLHSGQDASLEVSLTTFERTWEGGQYWAIVISPPDRIPTTATAERYLESLEDLIVTGQENAARTGYLAARQRWPRNARIAFGQGNLAYRMRDYAQAVESLEAATTMNPDDAASWNNLAYALAQTGAAEALTALDKALQLGGDRPEIRSSVEDVRQLLDQSSRRARNALGETPVR